MPWKLSRWKPCDGGCCVRSPRFPRPEGGPDPERPAFMADCVFHESTGSGTSPDGTEWRGGCTIYKQLHDVIAERGTGNSLRPRDLDSRAELRGVVRGEIIPQLRTYADTPAQWFLSTCWRWPVATPIIAAFIDRAKALGLFNDAQAEFSPLMAYDRVYTDEERAALAQEFHVTDEQVKDGSAASVPASCCHYWESV